MQLPIGLLRFRALDVGCWTFDVGRSALSALARHPAVAPSCRAVASAKVEALREGGSTLCPSVIRAQLDRPRSKIHVLQFGRIEIPNGVKRCRPMRSDRQIGLIVGEKVQ